jgi:hypothetical protein
MSQATKGITANPAESASSDQWANERRRRLEALSDPWWVAALLAEMNRNAKPALGLRPVNRDRSSWINPWGCK